jgi:glycosyltransferase involved in cell wall biosynthesis
MDNLDISVIIPTFHFEDSVRKVILALNEQSVRVNEVIIVDSSTNDGVKEVVQGFKEHQDNINYIRRDKSYPGEARNIGAKIAKGEWIAFVDSKTVPERNWIEESLKEIEEKELDVLFGVTQYHAKSKFQKLLRAASFGEVGHETTPGSMIKKELFLNSNFFVEGVRTADDLYWRDCIKRNSYKYSTPKKIGLTYSDLPESLKEVIQKYFIYAWHTSVVNVQTRMKDFYLGLLLILSALLVPRWNYLVSWVDISLFIPHVTKIYMLLILLVFFLNLLLNRFLSTTFPSFFRSSLRVILFLFIVLAVYNWNFIVAGWVEEATLFIPHITKIYLLSLLLASLLIRGLIMPLKRKTPRSFLFPFRWMVVGFIGVTLDLAKTPGYAFGSLLSPFLKKRTKE